MRLEKFLFFFVLFVPLYSNAFDIGVGSSSVTYGRPIPSLSLAFDTDSKWSYEYQSEGVQTTIYSQNSWTLAGYKTFHENRNGILGATIGAGIGATYILRTFRDSPTATIEQDNDFAMGPFLSAKFKIGRFFLAFNTLLGLTSEVQQHIFLNYQEVSHIVIGVSL